jgi:hypothetical protein
MQARAVAAQNSAEWDSLPHVLTEIIAEHAALELLRCYRTNSASSRRAILGLRLMSRAFATALSHAWKLYPPRTTMSTWSPRPYLLVSLEALPTFVEGILRLVALFAVREERFSTGTFSSLYTEIITSCCQKGPNSLSGPLYDQVGAQMSALAKGGALRDLTGERRALFVRMVACLFRYLDRYYVPRFRLAEIGPCVLAAFAEESSGVPDNQVAAQNTA